MRELVFRTHEGLQEVTVISGVSYVNCLQIRPFVPFPESRHEINTMSN